MNFTEQVVETTYAKLLPGDNFTNAGGGLCLALSVVLTNTIVTATYVEGGKVGRFTSPRYVKMWVHLV